jgi:hypothetical protein
MDFEWDDGNIGHREKHGPYAREIEWVIERGLIEFDRNPLGRRAAESSRSWRSHNADLSSTN